MAVADTFSGQTAGTANQPQDWAEGGWNWGRP